jgi:hypothetical protein
MHNMAADSHKLIYCGKYILDDNQLKDYGIKNEAVLYVVVSKVEIHQPLNLFSRRLNPLLSLNLRMQRKTEAKIAFMAGTLPQISQVS